MNNAYICAECKCEVKEGESPSFSISMIRVETIREKLAGILSEGDMFLVDIQVSSGNNISIEIDDAERFIKIEDCIKVSKTLEGQLDREVEDFSLQVGSPGLSNPFKVKKQYFKNIGRELRVLLKDGRVEKGLLKNATDDKIILTTKVKERIEGRKAKQWTEKEIVLSYEEIKETTIIISFK